LSFEFTTIQPCVAVACIERSTELGYTHYNAVLGESLTFVHEDWTDAEAIAAWVRELPQNVNSGDVYARLPARSCPYRQPANPRARLFRRTTFSATRADLPFCLRPRHGSVSPTSATPLWSCCT